MTTKIAIVQFNPIVGDLDGNADRIIAAYDKAAIDGAELVVFPECALTGYPLEDLVLRESFMEEVAEKVKFINTTICAKKTGPTIIYGTPHRVSRGIRNAAYVVDPQVLPYSPQDGQYLLPIQLIYKTELPNYGVFDEKRVFISGDRPYPIIWRGHTIGLMICEDCWFPRVSKEMMDCGAQFLISINGSPFEVGKNIVRHNVIKDRVNETGLPFLYVNMVGGQDELVFDGGSFLYDGNLKEFPSFKEDIFYVDVTISSENRHTNSAGEAIIHISDDGEHSQWIKQPEPLVTVDNYPIVEPTGFAEIYQACVLGTRDYMHKQGFKSVVLGYSGGVDSGLVAAIAADAAGPNNVHLVRLPSKFSSQHSLNDAAAGSDRLNAKIRTISIEPVVEALRKAYADATDHGNYPEHNVYNGGHENLNPRKLVGVADENIQARARGNILMAISNQEHHLLLTTGNKSEVSVGYCVSGNTLISTDQGLFFANELRDTYLGKTIKGFPIINAFTQRKNSMVSIEAEQGMFIECGNEHPFKVYNVETGETTFVKAENLTISDILIGSEFFCEPTEEISVDYIFERKKYDFRSPKNVTLPKVIDKEAAKFLGICVADGCFAGGTYTITTGKDEVISFTTDLLNKLNVSFRLVDAGSGVSRIVCSSVELIGWLHYCGVQHLAISKIVPWVILRSPIEVIREFLSGLLLDSSLNSKKNTTELVFNSKNPELARQVHVLMGSIGVRAYLRPTKHGRNSVYIPSSEQYNLISIKNKNSRVMHSQDENRIKPRSGIDFIYFTKDDLNKIALSLPWEQRITVRRAKNKLSRSWVLEKVKKGYLDPKWLKNNIRFLTIKNISHDIAPVEFYDFTVQTLEQFEANGFTVHNCTLYGDMSGGFNPIKDLYKTTVWELCRWRNNLDLSQIQSYGFFGTNAEVVPEAIIVKPPSAELRPDQFDEQSLPPYPVLDSLLKGMIENELSVDEIATQNNLDRSVVMKIRQLVDNAEYKRRQAAPGVKITSKIHGRDRRYPIVNAWRG